MVKTKNATMRKKMESESKHSYANARRRSITNNNTSFDKRVTNVVAYFSAEFFSKCSPNSAAAGVSTVARERCIFIGFLKRSR